MRILSRAKRRRGVSELVATVLTIAITIITGTAVFGYVNNQAGLSENAYGQNSVSAIEALQENFAPFNMGFTSTAVSIYFYNSGATRFYPVQVTIYDSAKALDVLYTPTEVVNLNNPSSCTESPSSSFLSHPLYDPSAGSQPSGVYGIAPGGISYLTLTLPSSCSLSFSTSGTIYYLVVTGLHGNTVTFAQSG